MVNESSQPKPGDAVLGGNNPPPLINAAVLGGVKGAKQRCTDPNFKIRIGGLQEAVKYGDEGIELLLYGLKDKVLEVGLVAYSLLQENVEPELKMALKIYEPYPHKHVLTIDSIPSNYLSRIPNLNIVYPIALFHNYLEIKQPQNSSLYKVIQLLNSGTKAEQEAAFLQLKSRKEPAIKALLWPYINALEPEVFHDYKLLKYFLAVERWQDAKKESKKILFDKLGKKLTAIQGYEHLAEDTLNKLSLLWEQYAVNPSSIKEQKPLDFPTKLKEKIQSIRSYKPYEEPDIFSRRCYSQTHD